MNHEQHENLLPIAPHHFAIDAVLIVLILLTAGGVIV